MKLVSVPPKQNPLACRRIAWVGAHREPATLNCKQPLLRRADIPVLVAIGIAKDANDDVGVVDSRGFAVKVSGPRRIEAGEDTMAENERVYDLVLIPVCLMR